MTLYLTNLAKAFHAYYAANKIIDVNNDELSCQRYYLAQIVKIVIKKGLDLIGIKAVDKM
jgi:arginyl-tRNA synthetase